MVGYTKAELDEKNWQELTHPDDLPHDEQVLRSILENKIQSDRWEKRYIHKKESIVWADVSTRLEKDSNGTPLYLITSIVDISDRKQSEIRLRRLNRTYCLVSAINKTIVRVQHPQDLFEAVCKVAIDEGGFVMAWIGLLDADNKLVNVVAHAGMTGSYLESLHITLNDGEYGRGPPATAIKTSRYVVANDIGTDSLMAPWREDALGMGYRSSAAFPLTADGKVCGSFNLYSAEKNFFDGEELNLIDDLAANISFAMEFFEKEKHRVQAETAMRESEEKFRLSFMNNLDVCYIGTVDEGIIIEVNDVFEKVFGYSRDEAIGKTTLGLNLYANSDDRGRIITEFKAKGKLKEIELTGRNKCGGLMDLTLSASLIMINNKPHLLGILRDITERKKIEQELLRAKNKAEESDRLKSAFLANMSHEIRTPMNGILGFAELLKEPELTGEEQQEYIRIIEKSGARMLSTINEIVDIAKIESGLMEIFLSDVNLNIQMDFIYNFFKAETDGKGINLSYVPTFTEKESNIKTDKGKLNSILTNLIKNAVKYTREGSIEFGYYLAKTDYQGSFLEFFVKDTGIGIPANRLEAIFERFIQADIYNVRALQGSGLGLSISRSYVEMLGGKLWVESESGKGSTFYFTIPYVEVG